VPHGAGCGILLAATTRTNLDALGARAPAHPTLAAYREVLTINDGVFLRWFANSAGVALVTALLGVLLAAGAVACEQWLHRLQPNTQRWSRAAVGIGLAGALATGVAVGLPWAPVNSPGWRISRAAHDNFAEQVGWPDYVAQVAAVYVALPPAERTHTVIYANNYGEAGAIDLYGPRHGLPRAISPVNSFWFRGYGTPPPSTVIVLGDDADGMRDTPADCTLATRFRNPQNVENEETSHPDIYVCRNLRAPWSRLWPEKPSYG
jgi:hypothetical protein